jgi:hypothetical protein
VEYSTYNLQRTLCDLCPPLGSRYSKARSFNCFQHCLECKPALRVVEGPMLMVVLVAIDIQLLAQRRIQHWLRRLSMVNKATIVWCCINGLLGRCSAQRSAQRFSSSSTSPSSPSHRVSYSSLSQRPHIPCFWLPECPSSRR